MKRIYQNLILLASIAIFNCSAFSVETHPWQFEIAPYLWGINMNGTVGVGPVKSHLNESFSDLLSHLNFAAMLYAAAHKENFGVYFNGIYSITSDNMSINAINVNGQNKFGIYAAGVSYIFYNENYLQIEPYLGFRYTLNNTTININNFSFKKNVNWTDPVIGARLNYDFTKSWSGILTGDIGGTNTSTHYSYSAAALVGYHPVGISFKYMTTYLGYRLLQQHYQTGSGVNFYNWNVRLFGPLIGVAFNF
jgi:hypothetical protein